MTPTWPTAPRRRRRRPGWDLLADIEALTLPPSVVVFSASEVDRPQSARVAAVLLKAQTSNDELLQALQRVLGQSHPPQPLGA